MCPIHTLSFVCPVLSLVAAFLARSRQRSWDKVALNGLRDDLRDNILNYDEQGGGEEDQVGFEHHGKGPQGPGQPPRPRFLWACTDQRTLPSDYFFGIKLPLLRLVPLRPLGCL